MGTSAVRVGYAVEGFSAPDQLVACDKVVNAVRRFPVTLAQNICVRSYTDCFSCIVVEVKFALT